MTARRRHHRRGGRRRVAIAIGVLAVLVVGAGAAVGAHAWSTYRPAIDDAQAARSALERLVDRAKGAGLDLGRDDVTAMQADLALAAERFTRLSALLADDPLVALARALPPVRETVEGTDAVMAAAGELLGAADAAIGLADRFVGIKEAQAAGGGDTAALAQLVALMATGRSEVDAAVASLDRAGALLATTPADLPGPIGQVRDLMVSRLDDYAPALRGYAGIDETMPGILGWDRPKRYLVLTQNPAELRPTGGYIGSFGTIVLDRGHITERAFQDVFLLDTPWDFPFVEPPDALRRYLLGPEQPWQLADANWSPDFPTSARQAVALYQNEGGAGPIDGVLGISTYTIDELLALTGPVTVPDYGVTIAAGETTLKVLQNTRVAREPDENRKAFLSAFADRLFGSLLGLSPRRWIDVAARGDAFRDQRLLLAWFDDPAAQAQMAAMGFDGAVRQDAGDYLYPVDSNVAPTSKLDAVTDRELDLDVRLDGVGNAANTLTVTWSNRIASDAARPYRELPTMEDVRTEGMYFRLLVPERSRLERVTAGTTQALTAPSDVGMDAGRSVIANYFRIPAGTARLRYEWTSPYPADLGDDGVMTYRLTVQKQPGLRPGPIRVRIILPEGSTLIEASPGLAASAGDLVAETTFDRDLVVVVRYRPATDAP